MDCPKIPAASPPKSLPTSPISRVSLNEDWVLSLPCYQRLMDLLVIQYNKTYTICHQL